MNRNLKAFLREDEVVEWRSAPYQISLLDADTNTPLIRRWVVTALVTLTLLTGYAARFEVNRYLVLWVLCGAGYSILSPLLEFREIRKFHRYYLTNQRAIFATRDAAYYYMNYGDIDAIKEITGLSGQTSLVMGSCLFEKAEKQLRRLARYPREDLRPDIPRNCVAGMIFYQPKDAETACTLLRSHMRAEQAAYHPVVA
ncbi:MAG: hypothetical protein RR092_05020 [Oscillospiraceae bacterium]